MTNYLATYYTEDRRPVSDYPNKLARHLKYRLGIKDGMSLLDIGCGRGDMMRAFDQESLVVYGTDLDEAAVELVASLMVRVNDIQSEPLPFEDETFDVVFSKSVIEHLHDPTPMVKEALRVLKPGGVIVVMCPSWIHTRWGPFYLDHTHVTPFTKQSLRDLLLLVGFQNPNVEHFTQLPLVWRLPMVKLLCELIRFLPVPYKPMHDVSLPSSMNKFIRFSNEIMLLAAARK